MVFDRTRLLVGFHPVMDLAAVPTLSPMAFAIGAETLKLLEFGLDESFRCRLPCETADSLSGAGHAMRALHPPDAHRKVLHHGAQNNGGSASSPWRSR